MTDSLKNIYIGPANRFFIAQAVVSPLALLAILFGTFTVLPFCAFDLHPFVVKISALLWQHNLQVVAPILLILNALLAYAKMLTTVYLIDTGCLLRKTVGISGTRVESMTLALVVDCNVNASWFEAILGLSTLHIRSADQGEDDLFLRGVPDAGQVRITILDNTSVSSGRVLGTV